MGNNFSCRCGACDGACEIDNRGDDDARESCTICLGEGVLVAQACVNGQDVDDVQPCHGCQHDLDDRFDDYDAERADLELINPPTNGDIFRQCADAVVTANALASMRSAS